jgi:hypothetical protein
MIETIKTVMKSSKSTYFLRYYIGNEEALEKNAQELYTRLIQPVLELERSKQATTQRYSDGEDYQ